MSENFRLGRLRHEKPIMKTPLSDEDVEEMTKKIYQLFLTPQYAIRRVTSIKSIDDLRYTFRGLKKVLGHIRDFSVKKQY